MKRLLPFLFSFLVFQVVAQNTLNLIPQPSEIQLLPGQFTLKKNMFIGCNDEKALPVASMLAAKLNQATGFDISAKFSKGGNIFFYLYANDPALGKEGYTLQTNEKGIEIRANEPAGLFYGMQTLLQLFPKEIEGKTAATQVAWTTPAVKITDVPRFAWRGIMLDVSRHFYSVADVKKYINDMVRYKYNTFHWHLTDDNGWRVEIKSLPKLTSVGAWRVARTGHFGDREDPKPGEAATYGGFYTQEDIREVVRYAAERHVTIVPEIDVPGHSMAALAAYPELSCRKQPVQVNPGTPFADWYGNGTFKMHIENTLNPSDEKVYEFLDKVFTEVAQLFPNPYIHVGGDECYKGYWKEDPGCQALMKQKGIRHVEDLQGYFMERVEKILQAKGKKMIGWDEILEGGISPGAAVMSWRGVKGGIEAAQLGHEVVMTPTTYAYIDYNQGDQTVDPPIYAALRCKKSYSFEPVPDGIDPKLILGGQGNLWTEHLPSLRSAEYMTFPRAWALAEVFWSPKKLKNWDDFARRMEAHFERSNVAGVNYSKAIFDPIVRTKRENGQLMLMLEPEIPGLEIYYTFDDTMPDQNALHASDKAVPVPDGPVTLRAQAYRNGAPIGHLITLKREQLESRAE